MPLPARHRIHIVSDGRGTTCQQVIDAALVQFRDRSSETVLHAGVRTPEKVEEIVARAAGDRGVIFYTLVSPETRLAMDRAARRRFVPVVDVLGPALSALDDVFQSAPVATPGLLYEAHRESFDRSKAIRYALEHDDGKRPHEMDQADVVLVGVSRSSKTATCFYLAFAGVAAANVPLIPGIAPPPELLALPPEKVIGLRINTMRLRSIRQARFSAMKEADIEHYLDKRAISREVIEAMRRMKDSDWRSIDVSYRAIEEVASRVMEMCELKRRKVVADNKDRIGPESA